MKSYRNQTALVTGASSGIGEAFARELAARGMNLILVARSQSKLEELAADLAGRHKIKAEVITADLTHENAGAEVFAEVQQKNLTVDLLINNAGVSYRGEFEELPLTKNHAQIMLNVAALVDLTHAFLPAMLAKGDGSIINVASGAGFYPVPYQAVYAASKAFVVSFSEALWEEYRTRGVHVLTLCPGATDTNVFNVQGSDVKIKKDKPERVVNLALQALEKKRHLMVPGFENKFESLILPKIMPRSILPWFVAKVSERIFDVYKPKYSEKHLSGDNA